jgi:hypothetical protein
VSGRAKPGACVPSGTINDEAAMPEPYPRRAATISESISASNLPHSVMNSAHSACRASASSAASRAASACSRPQRDHFPRAAPGRFRSPHDASGERGDLGHRPAALPERYRAGTPQFTPYRYPMPGRFGRDTHHQYQPPRSSARSCHGMKCTGCHFIRAQDSSGWVEAAQHAGSCLLLARRARTC